MNATTHAPTQDHEGIARTIRKFEEAFSNGDPRRATMEIYTKNARILPPGAPMIAGRENIADFWAGAAQQWGITGAKLTTMDLQIRGEWAHEIGRATLSLGSQQETTVKYAMLWKRDDGIWRFDVDIWNTDE